jgi:hypothetical protein
MKEAFKKVNLNIRRQKIPSSFVFDVYFNVVAANMSSEGGWVPYVLQVLDFPWVC